MSVRSESAPPSSDSPARITFEHHREGRAVHAELVRARELATRVGFRASGPIARISGSDCLALVRISMHRPKSRHMAVSGDDLDRLDPGGAEDG